MQQRLCTYLLLEYWTKQSSSRIPKYEKEAERLTDRRGWTKGGSRGYMYSAEGQPKGTEDGVVPWQ